MKSLPRRPDPATLLEAGAIYPDFILSLARGNLMIKSEPRDGLIIYHLTHLNGSVSILEVDFLLLKKIASRLLSPFLSEPESSIKDRARELIKVEFSERSSF